MEAAPLLLGSFVVAFCTHVGHHGRGQLEVRCQPGGHGDLQGILALVEFDQPVVEHASPLEGDQGQCRLFPPVEADLGRVAHLVRVLFGKDAQADLVLVAGDLDRMLAPDRVLEPVGPFDADDVAAPLGQGERLPGGPVGCIRLQLVRLDQALADFSFDRRLLQHVERDLVPDRLALGVVSRDSHLERLAGHVKGPNRAHPDRKALGGEEEVDPGLQVPLGQDHDQGEYLGLLELSSGQLEADLTLLVGLGRVQALVGQLVADFAIRKRRPVVEARPDRALDRFAPVVDLAGRVDHQLNRLQLVLVHEEHALVAVAVDVAGRDAIRPLRAGRRQHEMHVERAERRQLDSLLSNHPIAAVEHLDRILLTLLDQIRIGGKRQLLGLLPPCSLSPVPCPLTFHVADAAPHVHQLPGAVGRPIGVDVAFVRKSFGDAHAFEVDHVGADVPFGDGEHAHVAGFLQFLVASLEHAVVAGSPLGEDLAAVGD